MSEAHDYEVGYGRPPKSTQFKKGLSGNPKGARNRRNMRKEDIVAMVRDELHPMKLNGKDTKITTFEAAVRATSARVIKSGNPSDLQKLLILYERYGVKDKLEQMAEAQAASEKVMQKVTDVFWKMTAGTAEPGEHEAFLESQDREKAECAILARHPHCLAELKRFWKDREKANSDNRCWTHLRKLVLR